MTKICPNCAQEIDQNAAFCGFCGAQYKAPAAPAPASPPVKTAAVVKPVSMAKPGQEQMAPVFHLDPPSGKGFAIRAPAEKESHGWLWYCFSLNGRIGVGSLWLRGLAAFAACIVFIAIVQGGASLMGQPDSRAAYLVSLIGAAILYCSWMTMFIKRIHDLDHSGLYLFIFFIPILGQIAILILIFESLFVAGTDGPNKHGDYTY